MSATLFDAGARRALYASMDQPAARGGYELSDHGEGMRVARGIGTREAYLLNDELGEAFPLVDWEGGVLFFGRADIDLQSLRARPGYPKHDPPALHALTVGYGMSFGAFHDGKAIVEWTLYPQERYFDSDDEAISGSPDGEIIAYGVMDKAARMVGPFRAEEALQDP